MPATVTVPEGSTSATFPVTDGPVSASSLVTLTASYSGASVTFGLTVNPPAVVLSSLSCNPASLTPSAGSTCTVALKSAALSGGATIALKASPALVTMPATVTVPEGSTSATFPVTDGPVSASSLVTLTASYSGASVTFGLTVNPPAAVLSSVLVNPSTIFGGQSGTGTVSLTSVAGIGVVVSLSSSNASVASVQRWVWIPPGSSSATFPVNAGQVNASTPVTLTASYSGASVTFGLTVNPPAPALRSVSVSPRAVVSGGSGTGTVTITTAAGTGGVTVSLSSSDTMVFGVPSTVTIAEGANSATFPMLAGDVSNWSRATLTASYAGVSKTFDVGVYPLPGTVRDPQF
jgi:hypothetical protein